MAAWKRLPASSFRWLEEPGPYVGAPPKRIRIAETVTRVQGIARPVRTIVVGEPTGRGKERWHGLLLLHDDATDGLVLVREVRTRQHHEQGYRIGVHDLALDTVPSGYPKDSRPNCPGFRRGPIALGAWRTALAWHGLRTLRRWLLERPAELLLTRTHLFVVLESRRGHGWLLPLLRRFNALKLEVPWLDHRCVALGFVAPRRQRRARRAPEVRSERLICPAGVWC